MYHHGITLAPAINLESREGNRTAIRQLQPVDVVESMADAQLLPDRLCRPQINRRALYVLELGDLEVSERAVITAQPHSDGDNRSDLD